MMSYDCKLGNSNMEDSRFWFIQVDLDINFLQDGCRMSSEGTGPSNICDHENSPVINICDSLLRPVPTAASTNIHLPIISHF